MKIQTAYVILLYISTIISMGIYSDKQFKNGYASGYQDRIDYERGK